MTSLRVSLYLAEPNLTVLNLLRQWVESGVLLGYGKRYMQLA